MLNERNVGDKQWLKEKKEKQQKEKLKEKKEDKGEGIPLSFNSRIHERFSKPLNSRNSIILIKNR